MVKNPIKVFARLKPEKSRKGLVNYQILHRTRENVEEDVFFVASPTSKSKDGPDNRPESWNFSFARIFEEATTQAGIFENVAQPVVDSALYGYNGTIFAYGQTATGKTYSITGRQEVERRGIIPRSLQYLFDAIRKRPENVYTVEVAYLEIYNETGYDLLDRGKRDMTVTKLEDLPRITLLEDEAGRLHMKNLTFHTVTNVEEAFELLLLGDNNRIVVETPMNSQSSRSHCIFTIVVSAKEFGADQFKRAKVHLVDLAGSERIFKCLITGTILTEAKHINLSLHYLEQVIVCLGQESASHIPYRNSLLTSILRDSLGGNCLTTMLATISLVSANIEETLSTCRFAQRVALIKNDAKLNLETDITNECALLRAENERLRQQIKELTGYNPDEELTEDDKLQLDAQVKIFLESCERVSWDPNPKKVQYCFESIKRTFELNKDPQNTVGRLEYYKDLVNQRDKEISLLLDMVKKAKGQNSSEPMSINNIQDGKESTVENQVCQKKPKRRPKVAKIVAQSQPKNDDRVAMALDKICPGVEDLKLSAPAKIPGKESAEQVLTSRTITIDRSRQSLPSCNVVNLSLDPTEEVRHHSVRAAEQHKKSKDQNLNIKLDDMNQQFVRAMEQQKKSIDHSVNIKSDKANQHSMRTIDQEKKLADQSFNSKLDEINQHFVRPADQQKKLADQSLNITLDKINQHFVRPTDQQKKLADQSLNIKLDEINQHFIRPTDQQKKLADQSLNIKLDEINQHFIRPTDQQKKLADKSLNIMLDEINQHFLRSTEQPKKSTDRSVNNTPVEMNRYSVHQREKKVKVVESKNSARYTNDKPEDERNAKASFTEMDYSIPVYQKVLNFNANLAEKPVDVKADKKTAKVNSARKSKSEDTCSQFDNLPLTGDPDIDEEIIAFYKAKRSGGAY